MAPVPVTIPDGSKIRNLRIEQGLTPEQLAARIGPHRHPQTIRAIERGGKRTGRVLLAQIARALGVTEADLVASDEDEDATAA